MRARWNVAGGISADNLSAAVAAVLDGRLTATQAVEQLMARDPKEELA